MSAYPQYRVFPATGKAPALSNERAAEIFREVRNPGGFHYCTDDPDLRDKLFATAGKGALIGVPMAINGLVALDYDPRNDHDGSGRAWLEAKGNLLAGTRAHTTKSGGLHVFFHAPEGVRFPAHVPGVSSIDIKHNGYVIWPPSAGYAVLQDVEPLDMPAPLLDLLQAREHVDVSQTRDLREDEKAMIAGLDAILSDGNERLIDQLAEKRNTLSGYDEWTRLVGAFANTFKGTQHEERARDVVRDFSLRWEADRADPESILSEFEGSWRSYGAMRRASGGVGAATAQRMVSSLPQKPEAPVELPRGLSVDVSKIPPRPWLLDRHYMRGYVTTTVAPGGTGKSTLAMIEALSMALNQPLLEGSRTYMPCKVLYWCGEDDAVELSRRYAAILMHYEVEAPENLFIVSGRDVPLTFAKLEGGDVVIDEKAADKLQQIIEDNDLDVIVIDPFAAVHHINENANDQVNAVMYRLSQLAHATKTSIELIHHTTKDARADGRLVGISGARGASAMVDATRSARYLTTMSRAQAELWQIPEDEAPSYVEVVPGKYNMAKSHKSKWIELQSVSLGNGTDEYPEGDSVGVAASWMPPSSSAPASILAEFRMQLTPALLQDPPDPEDLRQDGQSSAWAGHTLAKIVGLDTGSGLKKRDLSPEQTANRRMMEMVLQQLIKEGVLEVTKVTDNRGNERPAYRVRIAAVKRWSEDVAVGA